jgi:hypothetical protein
VTTGVGRRWLPGTAAALGLCLALWASPARSVAPLADAGETRFVDYLYVRANEGGSSGGHVAIRFDASIFHFQLDGGILRLVRSAWPRFDHLYRTLQNRDIELNRIAVSPETYAKLEAAFRRRHLVQERELAILDALRRDVRLLEAMAESERGRTPEPRVPVRGVGFFADDGPAPFALLALRRRIEAAHGPRFLDRRRREVEASIAALAPEPPDVDAISLDPDRYPTIPPTFSERVESLLAARFALERLAHPRPLARGVLAGGAGRADDPALALDPAERRRLVSLANDLRESLVRLAASRRPDWGAPLLLGMARLVALDDSARRGRLVVLDAFPVDAEAIPVTARRRRLLPYLIEEASADLRRERHSVLDGSGWREADYNDLEAAATRWWELRAARAGAPALRIRAGRMVPGGRGLLAPPPRPRGDGTPLAIRLARAREAEQRYERAVWSRLGYHLLRRNCVSELFRTVEAALAGPTAGSAPPDVAVRRASRARLGGYVDPVAELNFIPFVSSHRVRAHYRVVETSTLPSYRHFHLVRMREREGRWRVALRESNVITSTLHRGADDEGVFLFFTDDAVAPRPLLGALNLLVGLGRSAAGVLQLPFDGGRGLRAGVNGALFSLPELFFQNIRKGSNEYVPPGERPPAAVPDA